MAAIASTSGFLFVPDGTWRDVFRAQEAAEKRSTITDVHRPVLWQDQVGESA